LGKFRVRSSIILEGLEHPLNSRKFNLVDSLEYYAYQQRVIVLKPNRVSIFILLVTVSIVAYLLKARTVERENKPLLANGSETTFLCRQRLGKYVPAATDKHAATEVL
jgi:hypothetical protein